MPTPDWHPTDPDQLLLRAKARGTHLRWRRQATALATAITLLATTATFAAIADVGGADQTSTLAADGGSTTTAPAPTGEEGDSTTTTEGSGGTDREDGDAEADDGTAPSTTAQAETTATTAAPSTTTTAAAPVTATTRSPYAAPVVGTYRYRATDPDGGESEWRRTYELVHRNAKEVRLRQLSDGGPADDTMAMANDDDGVELSWRGDRVIVLNDDSCDESPEENAQTLYRFPMTGGTAWTWNSTCSNEDMGVIRSRGSAQVTERATHQVGGRSVDVWAIHATGAVQITLQGVTTTFYFERAEWFAPDFGLRTWMRSEIRQTEMRAGTERTSTIELLSLDPE